MNDIENWIKLRNQSVQSLKTTQKESDIASEIFTLWDVHFRHYLKFDQFSGNLINLGLIPDVDTAKKILIALKGEHNALPDQINFKEFKRIFDLSRFGNKVCEKLSEDFC